MMEVPYHYQFRIIVIGDTMVGKSSLLKTFSEGTFGEIEPTVGVDFFSKIIEIRPKQHQPPNNHHHHHHNQLSHNSYSYSRSTSSTSNYNNTNNSNDKPNENIIVKLQIWDTAGQERFKSIVTSYYRNSVGIVLVYDVTSRESYDHLIDWFTEARRHVEPGPSPTLSPITQNTPQFINPSSSYPLTSTPNASPTSKSRKSINNTTTSNSNFSDNSSMSFSSKNNNNAEASFRLTEQHLRQTANNNISDKNDNIKMAYLVLGCKTDLESQRQVSYEDGQAFADMYGFKFIETSSKTHYNVNQAFQLLAEEIYDKISEWGRLNRLHRTASGGHLTFDGISSQVNEGIRLGPLIEGNGRRMTDRNRVSLLEAQPVSGFIGGCC